VLLRIRHYGGPKRIHPQTLAKETMRLKNSDTCADPRVAGHGREMSNTRFAAALGTWAPTCCRCRLLAIVKREPTGPFPPAEHCWKDPACTPQHAIIRLPAMALSVAAPKAQEAAELRPGRCRRWCRGGGWAVRRLPSRVNAA